MKDSDIRKQLYSNEVSPQQKQYLSNYLKTNKRIKRWQYMILILFLLLWQTAASFGWIDPFIFSSPGRLLKCGLSMIKDGSLMYHTGITLLETFVSFFLVNLIGILAAVILWWNNTIAKIFEPYLVVLNSLPKSALAPVFIVWLGANMKTIIVAAVSVAVFGTILNLFTSFQTVEQDKIRLIQTLGGSKKDVLFKVILPGNIPAILSQMKVNIGLSLVGVIIGEFLAAKSGLGYLIIYSSQVFRLDCVILSIVILCIVATGLFLLLSKIEKHME
ncbi:MAG: ABC transporter permease [Clostridiales bacterium]|nr:ABC transporter permease [Clostridiales bacterium]